MFSPAYPDYTSNNAYRTRARRNAWSANRMNNTVARDAARGGSARGGSARGNIPVRGGGVRGSGARGNVFVRDRVVTRSVTRLMRERAQNVQEPVVQEPVVQEPVVQEPVVQEPVVQEPVQHMQAISPYMTRLGNTFRIKAKNVHQEFQTTENDDLFIYASYTTITVPCARIIMITGIHNTVKVTNENSVVRKLIVGSYLEADSAYKNTVHVKNVMNCEIKSPGNEVHAKEITQLDFECNSINCNLQEEGTCEKYKSVINAEKIKEMCVLGNNNKIEVNEVDNMHVPGDENKIYANRVDEIIDISGYKNEIVVKSETCKVGKVYTESRYGRKAGHNTVKANKIHFCEFWSSENTVYSNDVDIISCHVEENSISSWNDFKENRERATAHCGGIALGGYGEGAGPSDRT